MSDRTCTWDGCGKNWLGQGYCSNHYQQARRLGIIEKIELPHRLSDVDVESLTANCSDCGDGVPVISNSTGTRCREWARELGRAKYHRDLERRRAYHREYHRRYKFGLPKGGIEALLESVGWACEICSKTLDVKSARLDHDHSCCPATGRTCGECLRGILCNTCNTGIGMLGESPTIFAAALAYIGRSK